MSEIQPLLSCTTTTLVVYAIIISLLDYIGLLFITFPITINSPYYSQNYSFETQVWQTDSEGGPHDLCFLVFTWLCDPLPSSEQDL